MLGLLMQQFLTVTSSIIFGLFLKHLLSKYKRYRALEDAIELKLVKLVFDDVIFQAKGVTFDEIEDLGKIMQGKSKSSDLDAAIVVAKLDGTIMYDQFLDQIKGSKQNITSLIDRIDQKRQINNGYDESEEKYFYQNTGFRMDHFLPQRKA